MPVVKDTKPKSTFKLSKKDQLIMNGFEKSLEKQKALATCNKRRCPQEFKAYQVKADATIKTLKKHFDMMIDLMGELKDKKITSSEYKKRLAAIKADVNKINRALFETMEARKFNECSVNKCQKENVEHIRAAHDVATLRCKLDKHKMACENAKLGKNIVAETPLNAKSLETYWKNRKI